MRGILLWLIGIPIPVIILIYLLPDAPFPLRVQARIAPG